MWSDRHGAARRPPLLRQALGSGLPGEVAEGQRSGEEGEEGKDGNDDGDGFLGHSGISRLIAPSSLRHAGVSLT